MNKSEWSLTEHFKRKILRFEKPEWQTTPIRKVEAALQQLMVLNLMGKAPKSLESRLRYYLGHSRFCQNEAILESIAYRRAKTVISTYLKD